MKNLIYWLNTTQLNYKSEIYSNFQNNVPIAVDKIIIFLSQSRKDRKVYAFAGKAYALAGAFAPWRDRFNQNAVIAELNANGIFL
jgi:hypothetical protein